MRNLLFAVVSAAIVMSSCKPQINISVSELPDTTQINQNYTGNRLLLVNTPFIKLPIGSIETGGWLRKQLELMADGYFGNLGDISSFLVKENNSWLSPDGIADHGW